MTCPLQRCVVNGNALKAEVVRVETDPHGTTPNTPGAKLDAGKPRVGLMLAGFSKAFARTLHFCKGIGPHTPESAVITATRMWPHALEEVAKVTTAGASKYTPGGWASVPGGVDRYFDAYARHLLAIGRGEEVDDGEGGTGCLHTAQCIWNLLAALSLWVETTEEEQRARWWMSDEMLADLILTHLDELEEDLHAQSDECQGCGECECEGEDADDDAPARWVQLDMFLVGVK